MARQEGDITARGAARREEEWSGHRTARKSSARKAIKSKASGVAAAKSRSAKKARPKQRIAISHHREEDFKADGLRAYAKYRDLGIADATARPGAGACDPPAGPCNPAKSQSCISTTSNSRWSTCSRAG